MSVKNTFKKLDDDQLIQLYVSGNEIAFETLLTRHKDRVFRQINSKLRDIDLANDLFQETFIKVINTLKSGSYNGEGKFLPWVLRIANNLIIDYFRKENRIRVVRENSSSKDDFNIFSILKVMDKNIEQSISQDELEQQMIHLLDFLPEPQKDIIEKRLFQDLSFKDISEQDGISINTALGRMRYALINIRRMIEENKLIVDLV